MRWVLLLRGINVGTAKRMPMAELRAMLERLGFEDVKTLLNSGNAVFSAPSPSASRLTASIGQAVVSTFGFSSKCFVLSGRDLETIARENALADRTDNDSRLVVAFLPDGLSAKVAALVGRRWGDEALAVGSRAAYLWCPGGIAVSPLVETVGRALGTDVTMRNWATVKKIRNVL